MKPITHDEAKQRFPEAIEFLTDSDPIPPTQVFFVDIRGVLWTEDPSKTSIRVYWDEDKKAWEME